MSSQIRAAKVSDREGPYIWELLIQLRLSRRLESVTVVEKINDTRHVFLRLSWRVKERDGGR